MGLKLIVNADDFGISGEVNEGIRLAHLNGVLTSTSIMPVGESFAEAVALSATLPELDIGIHLTLVGERPLLPADRIPTLVDENGRFHAHATVFMRRFLLGKIDRHEVHAELEAQVQKVLESGLDVSHLDTHQHLHALPPVLREVTSIAKQYGILRIRRPAERLRRYMFGNPGGLGRIAQMLVLNTYCRAGDWQDMLSPRGVRRVLLRWPAVCRQSRDAARRAAGRGHLRAHVPSGGRRRKRQVRRLAIRLDG